MPPPRPNRVPRSATPPSGRGGDFGWLEDDDPSAEEVIRAHAERTGQDPDKLVADELAARRKGKPRSISDLDAAAPKPAPAAKPAPPAPPEKSRAQQAAAARQARPQKRLAPAALRPSSRVGGVTVADASGFMLALLAWGWIGLPYLKDGPNGVRNVWRAKFLNKGPKGEVLL